MTVGETVITPGVEWLLAIAAAITALTVIWKALQFIRMLTRRMEEFFDDYFGTPEDHTRGKAAQPGVMERLSQSEEERAAMAGKLDENTALVRQLKDRVEYEMSTNGGGSMRDEVRDLSVEQSKQGKQIKEIKESAEATHQMLADRISALEAIDLAERVRALENNKEANGSDDPQH